MASTVIRAANDMQQRYHDYLNSQRVDLWPISVRNYIEFGGTNPPNLVLNGQPVPIGGNAGRSPASFSNSSTISLFAELALNGTPPVPIMPPYPHLATSITIGGSGGELTPPSSTESNSGRQQTGSSRERTGFELPPIEELRSMTAGRSVDEAILRPGDLIVTRANTILSDTL